MADFEKTAVPLSGVTRVPLWRSFKAKVAGVASGFGSALTSAGEAVLTGVADGLDNVGDAFSDIGGMFDDN